jgi:hypothetical protein
MRKLTWFCAVLGIALVTAGAAIAVQARDRSTTPVSATFNAASASHRTTTNCTTSDGTFQITRGTYSGQSTGDAALTGPIQLAVRAVINTTDQLGTVDGSVVVFHSGRDTRAHLAGVYKGGKVSGLVTGEGVPVGQHLVATLTSSFSGDGGFTGGSIGAGSVDGAGVLTTGGDCPTKTKTPKPPAPPSGQIRVLGGNVSALTDTSITIDLLGGSSFSCSLDSHTKADISRQHIVVTSRVSATCGFKAGAWTLLHIKKLG